jgi:hypothetical protein
MKTRKTIFLLLISALMIAQCKKQPVVKAREVWTIEQANAWYQQQDWPRGCNFIPSTAINQLESWAGRNQSG